MVIILLYVNDMIICGDHESFIAGVKQKLDAKVTIKDIGLARYFLGLEIFRSSAGILIHQRKLLLTC